MRTLAVRAGVLPVFAALPVLLVVVSIEWQARLARSAFAELPRGWFAASIFAASQFPTLASFSAARPQMPDAAPQEGGSSVAPAPVPRQATFAERFAAAFRFYEGDDDATASDGRAVYAPLDGELEVTTASLPDEHAAGSSARGPREDDPSRFEGRTAVYVIASHAVYLPSGRKLEAHSGIGGNMDNPRHVSARNRGPTPPNVYDLALRRGRFHGVQAIRLIPVDENKMFGRDGMLAHSYMLGSSGQSNGCVVFRDYSAFLSAFQRGEVRRLVVVDRLDASKPDAVLKLAQGGAAPRF
jgi:hypothetical protein